MRKIFLTISFMSFVFNFHAQNTISGTVRDNNNQSLPGASIIIKNSTKGTSTDLNGRFMIANIQKSDIEIRISYSGFHKEIIPIHFDISNKEIDIVLKENVFEIDEVILSTPFNKLQSENVVKVAYRSIQSMQKKGSINLMDGIAQISGVQKMSTGTGISKPVIRGMSGNRVLVYNQGVRLENFQYGDKHGLGINESGIESVEVIKGPASLLYGSDAIGGVIYLIPEKYAESNQIETNLRSQYMSNTRGINSSLGLKTSTDNWRYLIRLAQTKHADYQLADKQRVTNSRFNDRDIKAGISYKKEKNTFDFRYNFNRSNNAIPSDIAEQETDYKITGLQQNIDNHVISLKSKIKLNETSLKTNIGYTLHNRVLLDKGIQKIGMQLNTFNYDTKLYLPQWKNLESIVGVQGMLQSNTNFGKNYLLPNATISSIGVFSTFYYKIKNTSIQSGFRYDNRHILTNDVGEETAENYRPGFNKYLNSYTGSFGFKSEILNKLNYRLNLAAGFRSPNLSELASKGQHAGRIELGNQNITNENNWQTDMALEYNNSHIEVFANTFYNQISNYIYLAPTGETQNEMPVYQYVQENASLYGGEIGIHLHPHPLDWMHIDTSYETVVGQRNNKEYLPLIPANQWNNQIRLTNNQEGKHLKKYYLNLSLNHTFKTSKISNFEKQRPAYSLFDTSVGGDFSLQQVKLNVNLAVHNLLNKSYVSHLSILRDNEIANMGRNIVFSINMYF
jgi:iron complex outermembrane receptor protein